MCVLCINNHYNKIKYINDIDLYMQKKKVTFNFCHFHAIKNLRVCTSKLIHNSIFRRFVVLTLQNLPNKMCGKSKRFLVI